MKSNAVDIKLHSNGPKLMCSKLGLKVILKYRKALYMSSRKTYWISLTLEEIAFLRSQGYFRR